MDLLLLLAPLLILSVSIYVFVKGYKNAIANNADYDILSALENPVPAELEAKQLLMEYASAVNGNYSEQHVMQHTMQWVKKMDSHVKRNKSFYENEMRSDQPIEQLAQSDTNVVNLFKS